MGLSDPKHPLWPIIRMTVLFCGLTLILERTATHFDFGELTAAGAGGALVLVFDIIKRNVTTG